MRRQSAQFRLRLVKSWKVSLHSGVASAVKEPGHFEVRNPPARSPGCTFASKKLTTFLVVLSPSKHRPAPFHRQNKTDTTVRYDNIFVFCSHYYRSKAICGARQGGARAWARAVDLPARSYDPGVAPLLGLQLAWTLPSVKWIELL